MALELRSTPLAWADCAFSCRASERRQTLRHVYGEGDRVVIKVIDGRAVTADQERMKKRAEEA